MAKATCSTSKKIGGVARAKKAREEMQLILTDENHPLYLAKDIEFARRYDVSRLTIYNIRDDLKQPSRYQRIVKKLKSLDLSLYTINDLTKMLQVKYQNLYKIILENKLKVKVDDTRKTTDKPKVKPAPKMTKTLKGTKVKTEPQEKRKRGRPRKVQA